MKSIITFFFLGLILSETYSQAPQKMSYQAIIRNNVNALVPNKQIGIKISILQNSTTGTLVYAETQTAGSNQNGMISIEIGGGSPVTGSMNMIDWAKGPFFIKTETDPAGGTNYTITSTTQLLSVPFAFHAKTAETAGNISASKFYLGQDTLGGIVFHIYKGGDGKEHGFIVCKEESSGVWQTSPTLTNATRSWDGADNTSRMTNSPAAAYVKSLTDGGYTDWYLPSLDEFNLLYINRLYVNKVFTGGTSFPFLSNTGTYWTSNEY